VASRAVLGSTELVSYANILFEVSVAVSSSVLSRLVTY
jgi:hypothetical protein